MKEEDIPDLNVFMMCERLDEKALTNLASDYTIRSCRPEELPVWKAFPFDTDVLAKEYEGFMTNYFLETYSKDPDLFFKNTLFVCDKDDRPIATCASWKAYDKFYTIHWFKTLKTYEGKGIGRALFSFVMKRFKKDQYPVFLHTQPGSFRAIKLYSDFGFHLLSGEFGSRKNDIEEYLPILKEFMPQKDYEKLKIVKPPVWFMKALEDEKTPQF